MTEEAPKRKAGHPDWVKGRSGNPSGKSKTAWLTNALKLELAQDPGRARRIAVKILDMAEEGELEAAKLVFDRTEGRAIQQVEVSQTITSLSPSEIDSRIAELSRRLQLPALIHAQDATDAEIVD